MLGYFTTPAKRKNMNKKHLLSALTALCVSSSALAGSHAHWSYSGETGPEHWGELDPAFAACSAGKNQSPIDLSGFIEADLPAIGFDYASASREILNNGHTVQVNMTPGSTITVDGQTFELKQFHFHAPSENHINGKSFPMEAHFVHADAAGNLAVVAVMFEEGAENPSLQTAWDHMPAHEDEDHPLPGLSAADLMPADKDYDRFNGSLTTPPCTEGVRWLVLKTPITASKAQIEQFSHVMHHANNRPVQSVNARPVLQ